MHEGAQFENVSHQKHIQKLRLEVISIHPPKVAHFFYEFFSKKYWKLIFTKKINFL